MSAHLYTRALSLVLVATGFLSAQTPLITTAAGSGPGIGLTNALGFAFDSHGNIYVADNSKSRVFKIDANGTITPFAGTGSQSCGADNVAASSSGIWAPYDVVVDAADNLYISDFACNVVRRVDANTGLITTVAGISGFVSGQNAVSTGDGGPATAAHLVNPTFLAYAGGTIYLLQTFNAEIRKFTVGGNIVKAAGGDINGNYVAGDPAHIGVPGAFGIDASGTLYIATGNVSGVIIKIPSGSSTATEIAGKNATALCPGPYNGTAPACWDGTTKAATSTQIDLSSVLFLDSGFVYFNPQLDGRIARVPVGGGNIESVAGTGVIGTTGDGGPATSARIGFISGMGINAGTVYIAVSGTVRRFTVGGNITLYASSTPPDFAGDGGPATAAKIQTTLPKVAFDSAGNMYVPDAGNKRVRKVDAATQIITTIAGNGNDGPAVNGANALSTGFGIAGIAVDSSNNIYIAEAASIWKFTAGGTITRVAGTGTQNSASITGLGECTGAPTACAFGGIGDIAIDSANNIYIADTTYKRIRKFTIGGNMSTTFGAGAISTSRTPIHINTSGAELYASLTNPLNVNAATVSRILPSEVTIATTGSTGVAANSMGHVAYANANQAFQVASGTTTTIAGTGTAGYNGDGIPAPTAQLNAASGLAYNSLCDLFIGDNNNQRVRQVPNIVTSNVATSPSGLNVIIDGSSQIATQTKFWESGTTHTLNTTTPQTSGADTKFLFLNWSQGGAQNQTITSPGCTASITYTANFQTQYRLLTALTPAGSGTVTPVSGGFINAGTVTNLVATPNANYVFGTWTGDTVANASNASTTITMNAPKSVTANFLGITTTAAANKTANFSTSNQTVALTASVTSVTGTVGVGTVTFTIKNGAATIGSPVTSGTVTAGAASANFTLPSNTAPGTYTIQAAYSGGTAFAASSDSTHTLIVSPAPTTTTAANKTAAFNSVDQTVALTATVTSAGGTVAGGTVTFTVKNGPTTIGVPVTSAAVASGAASANFTLPGGTAVGTYSIDVSYGGSTNFAASGTTVSGSLNVTTASTTTTVANKSATFSATDQTVALTATVTSTAGSVDGGTVTFTVKNGGTTIGVAVVSATVAAGAASANFTLPGGTANGSYSIQAVYSGSTNFATSTATPGTLSVGAASTTTAASSQTATFSATNQTVALSASVTSTGGTVAGGTVTFTVKNGAVTIGAPVTSGAVASGSASANFTLPGGTGAGSYTIQADYSGSAGFGVSSDSTHTLTVGTAATTTTAANQTATFSASNQTIALSATVTSAAGAVGSGTVTFTVKNGPTIIGVPVTSATVSAGAASANFTLPGGTASGSYTIQADYSGAANFAPSSDATHTLNVSGGTSTTAVATSGSPSVFGQPVTFTATVTASSTPTGSVQFRDGLTPLGAAIVLVNGQAQITVSSLTVGAHTISADYSGGGGFTPSSGSVSQQVDQPAQPLTVTAFRVLWGSQSYNVIGSSRNRLPWQISGIQVVFSAPVTSANVNSLSGVNPTGFSGLGTNTLTWSITPISLGQFTAALAGSGPNAISAGVNPLGSGAGLSQLLRVLYGDYNDDGVVNAPDLSGVLSVSRGVYNQLADMNGDGVVDVTDVQLCRLQIGTTLP